ncbi:hypothetical protein NIM86_16395 [Notoacmeibacter sp. MSK16QG-6]|nr:hypothetical protein [Notoacmeibacter sp. MSK16QG-6]
MQDAERPKDVVYAERSIGQNGVQAVIRGKTHRYIRTWFEVLSELSSYADSYDGLALQYDDGASAILAGIATSTPDWMMYI